MHQTGQLSLQTAAATRPHEILAHNFKIHCLRWSLTEKPIAWVGERCLHIHNSARACDVGVDPVLLSRERHFPIYTRVRASISFLFRYPAEGSNETEWDVPDLDKDSTYRLLFNPPSTFYSCFYFASLSCINATSSIVDWVTFQFRVFTCERYSNSKWILVNRIEISSSTRDISFIVTS